MWKSAMLCAMLKRASDAASAERIAFFSSIARCDDRAADPHLLVVVAAAGLGGHRRQRGAGLGPHDDEPAVGLHEDLEQAVEHLRQDVLRPRACCSGCAKSRSSPASCCSGLAESCHVAREPPLTSSVAMMLEASSVVVLAVAPRERRQQRRADERRRRQDARGRQVAELELARRR